MRSRSQINLLPTQSTMQLYVRPSAPAPLNGLPKDGRQVKTQLINQGDAPALENSIALRFVDGFQTINDPKQEKQMLDLDGRLPPISCPLGLPPCHKDYPGSPQHCNGFCGRDSCRLYSPFKPWCPISPTYEPVSPPPAEPSPEPFPESRCKWASEVHEEPIRCECYEGCKMFSNTEEFVQHTLGRKRKPTHYERCCKRAKEIDENSTYMEYSGESRVFSDTDEFIRHTLGRKR